MVQNKCFGERNYFDGKGLISCLLGLFLVGCVFQRTSPFVDDAGNPVLSPPIREDPNKAVILLYRPASFYAGGVSPTILVAGNPALCISKIPNGAYTWVELPPGQYSFNVFTSMSYPQGGTTTEISALGGKQYYLKIDTDFWHPCRKLRSSCGAFFKVIPTDGPEAKEEFKTTYYVKPSLDCAF